MLNEERRRAIIELLNRQGRVLVAELGRHFETSQVTIRKDLEVLHAHGLVHRTHGGALPARESALEDPTLREKEKLHRQEKMRIAQNALQKESKKVRSSYWTPAPPPPPSPGLCAISKNLTIITNAVNIAAELAGTSVEVILTGGTLRKNSFSLVGPIAEETLRRSAPIFFFSASTASTFTSA